MTSVYYLTFVNFCYISQVYLSQIYKPEYKTTHIVPSGLGTLRHTCHGLMKLAKIIRFISHTVYPKKYAHGFVVLCFVVVMQSFIMNSHEVFIHINQDCFAGTGAIVRLPQCQWSKPGRYGKISQCITTTKHSKAKTCAYFLGYTVCCHVELAVDWKHVDMFIFHSIENYYTSPFLEIMANKYWNLRYMI